MPAGIYSVAGTKVYIGNAMSQKTTNFVAADFNSDSWVAVGWLENIGKFGDTSTPIPFSAIDVDRTLKLKGVFDAGMMTITFGRDYTDSGQTIMQIANGQPFDYGIRVIFNDMPIGGVAGSIRYFIAKVMAFEEQLDTVNNVIRGNVNLGINSNIVVVNAH